MAERQIAGHDVFLFIDPLGGADYDTLVCLTSKSLNRTTATIDASTQCGVGSGPGTKTADVGFEGVQVWDPDTGRISGADLHDLWDASTTFSWKLAKAIPVEGDVTYSGTGFLTSLSDTYGEGNATFTGSISVASDVTKTITPAES